MKLDPTSLTVGTMISALLTVAACQSQADAPGLCRPDAAEALAGRDRVTDVEAMQLTGALIVRQIEPGQGVTMDYRQERVTIETDPGTGRIFRAYCG